MVEKTIFGTMEDGREVSRYTLTNQNGVSASFLDLGAIWSTMLVPDRNGEMADVLLGHETVADCLVSDGHLGEAVGRNANRIGGAVFTLNDKKYELTANDGPNNLHSGMDFYRNRIWAAEYETGVNQVSFTLESPDGDQGYPGNASIRVTYTLTDENEVKIHYEGTCDQDTIFNMTNHAYFNIGDGDDGENGEFRGNYIYFAGAYSAFPAKNLRGCAIVTCSGKKEEPVSEPSSEPVSESASEVSDNPTQPTSDSGIIALAVIASVAAAGAFAVKKSR